MTTKSRFSDAAGFEPIWPNEGLTPYGEFLRLASMLNGGSDYATLAAGLGTSPAKICRRMKLKGLSCKGAALVNAMPCDLRAMERLAALAAPLQDMVADALAGAARVRVTLSDVNGAVDAIAKTIDPKGWMYRGERGAARLRVCMGCVNRTGSQPELFGDAVPADSCGRCLDGGCFRRMERAAKREAVEAAVLESSGGAGADAVFACPGVMRFPWCVLRARRRRGSLSCAYFVWDGVAHSVSVKWGRPPADAWWSRRRGGKGAAR